MMIWMLYACKSSKQMYMKLLKEEWLESSSSLMLGNTQITICHGSVLKKQSSKMAVQLGFDAPNGSQMLVRSWNNQEGSWSFGDFEQKSQDVKMLI